eukprot:XP_011604602.1 PREDICTED: insulin receptor substrate 2-A-like isoform X2 [Takifugu rubripes]
MEENAVDHNTKSPGPSNGTTLSRISSNQAWESPRCPPPWIITHQEEQNSQDHPAGLHSNSPSQFTEEFFCSNQTATSLIPLASTLVMSSWQQSDVVKQGYLGKLERNHRRYFVLRAGSHMGPSRLEWYKNQQKFAAMEKSGSKAALFGSSKQGVIYLRCCLGVSRICSARRGHTVALYAKDQTMVLVAEDQWEQEEWYLAVKKLIEEWKEEECREGFSEEDDGYCTLPPTPYFREVWPVTVKPRGLGCSKSLTGESRLCLTVSSLILVKVGVSSDLPSVTIPLLSVRRFGHLDGSFYLELGRSAPSGAGEVWMEATDQAAQNIHEAVREAVRAMRVLPTFNGSPTSTNHCQTLASQRCRPKHKDKPVNVRSPGPRATPPTRKPESPTRRESHKPESALRPILHFSPPKSHPITMESKPEHHPSGMEDWEPEEEEQGLGYVMMSPQASQPPDDYVVMVSPHKHDWPACSTLQTSINSSTSVCFAPLFPSQPQTEEHIQPCRLTSMSSQQSEAGTSQSQLSVGCGEQRRPPRQTWTTSTPVRTIHGHVIGSPVMRRQGGSSSDWSPVGPPVRRSLLSSCLLSCLQDNTC